MDSNPKNFVSNTKIPWTSNIKQSLARHYYFHFSWFLPAFEFQARNHFSQPSLTTASDGTLACHLDVFGNDFSLSRDHAPARDPTHEEMWMSHSGVIIIDSAFFLVVLLLRLFVVAYFKNDRVEKFRAAAFAEKILRFVSSKIPRRAPGGKLKNDD